MDNFSTSINLIIKNEQDGTPHHESVLIVGDTPEYLITKGGFPSLKLAIQASVVSKACFEHGIKTSVLKRLPEIVNTPKNLFRSASDSTGNSVVVITLELHLGSPIVIPIAKARKVGRSASYNLIKSIYGKEGPDPAQKWVRMGLLIHDFS